jgi:hypothetical protein
VTVDPATKVVRVTNKTGAARGLFEVHYYFKLCNGGLQMSMTGSFLDRSMDRQPEDPNCDGHS